MHNFQDGSCEKLSAGDGGKVGCGGCTKPTVLRLLFLFAYLFLVHYCTAGNIVPWFIFYVQIVSQNINQSARHTLHQFANILVSWLYKVKVNLIVFMTPRMGVIYFPPHMYFLVINTFIPSGTCYFPSLMNKLCNVLRKYCGTF